MVGDKKYGTKTRRRNKNIKRLALHAASIDFVHPFSKEKMNIATSMPPFVELLMRL